MQTTVLLLFVAKKQFPLLGSFQMNLIVVILQLGELWSERGTLRKSDLSYDTCYTSSQTRDTPFFLRDVVYVHNIYIFLLRVSLPLTFSSPVLATFHLFCVNVFGAVSSSHQTFLPLLSNFLLRLEFSSFVVPQLRLKCTSVPLSVNPNSFFSTT